MKNKLILLLFGAMLVLGFGLASSGQSPMIGPWFVIATSDASGACTPATQTLSINHTGFTAQVCGSDNLWHSLTSSGAGTVTTTGSPASGNLAKFSGATSITNGDLSGDVTTSGALVTTIAANAVTSAKMAVVNTQRTCMIEVGDGTNTVVTSDYSPFIQGSCTVEQASTIVEVNLQADAGTPSVLLERRRGAATLADLLSGALAANGTTVTCARSGTSATCYDGTTSSGSITTSNTSLNAGDRIEVKSGTASTEKRLRITITYTVN